MTEDQIDDVIGIYEDLKKIAKNIKIISYAIDFVSGKKDKHTIELYASIGIFSIVLSDIPRELQNIKIDLDNDVLLKYLNQELDKQKVKEQDLLDRINKLTNQSI